MYISRILLLTLPSRLPGMSEWIQSLMDKTIRIVLPDSRIVTGVLVCADYQANVILNTVTIESPNGRGMTLPQCMVAGKNIKKLEILES